MHNANESKGIKISLISHIVETNIKMNNLAEE